MLYELCKVAVDENKQLTLYEPAWGANGNRYPPIRNDRGRVPHISRRRIEASMNKQIFIIFFSCHFYAMFLYAMHAMVKLLWSP
jgi:hypothetical protein